ncbi:PH domain-containing protein [Niveibacterium sp. SC-1]|uniref:PH domain-containing protein n=1 Tax=Niveibacterium sp. SC-1 TaxID=3135646 RepID=UPI00311E6851
MVYRSKIDAWLAVLLGGAMAAVVCACVELVVRDPPAMLLQLALVVLPGIGLPAWILVGTRYQLTRDALLVRCGPGRWRIPVADIERVTPSRDWASSPALSLDRLRVEYGGRTLLISPRDTERFLRELDALRSR